MIGFLENVAKKIKAFKNKFKYEKVKINEDIFVYESALRAKKLEDEIIQLFVLAGINGISVTILRNIFKTKRFFRYNHIHELLFIRHSDIWFSLRIQVNHKNRIVGMWTYKRGGHTHSKDCFAVLDRVKNILISGEENAIKD